MSIHEKNFDASNFSAPINAADFNSSNADSRSARLESGEECLSPRLQDDGTQINVVLVGLGDVSEPFVGLTNAFGHEDRPFEIPAVDFREYYAFEMPASLPEPSGDRSQLLLNLCGPRVKSLNYERIRAYIRSAQLADFSGSPVVAEDN